MPANTIGTWKSVESETSGVKPMAIEGRLGRDRERLAGMTDAERAWRRQWLKDQRLSPREPLYIPRDSPHLLNPIRRAMRWPLDRFVFQPLEPLIGTYRAKVTRVYLGRFSIAIGTVLFIGYYLKYSLQDWTNQAGWRMIRCRTPLYPGDEGYPHAAQLKEPRDYSDRGFKDSIFGKKYDNSRPFRDDIPMPELIPFTTVFKHDRD